jgi:DHA1 family bicyclomycin/chloramphenicol resistance-like MFS transporter
VSEPAGPAPSASIAQRFAAAGRGLDRSLALLGAIAFITQVGVAIMLPLLPLYATQLGAPPLVLGLLTSSFAVTNAVGQVVAGYVSDRTGPRRLIPSGLGLYAACNLLIATAASAIPLIVYRSLAGLGGGLNLVGERLYIRDMVDRARLAFANGILSAAGSAGTVFGPTIGGLLAATGDLRVPFLVVGVTSTIATVASLFLPRVRRARDGDANSPAAASTASPASDSAEAIDAAPPDRRRLVILLVANTALLAAFGAFITTYAPFATSELGWSTTEVGLLFSLFGLGDITLGPWLGHLADRYGRVRIGVIAAVPVAIFTLVLAAGAPPLILIPVSIIAGGGIAGFGAAWYALLGTATRGPRGGRAFGVVSALTTLGIVIGALVASVLWELIDVRAGMFVATAGVIVAGLALSTYPEERAEAAAA